MATTVLILDERRRVREELSTAVRRLADIGSVEVLSEPAELGPRLGASLPDLLLVGTQRASNACWQAAAQAIQEFPSLSVVVVGSADDSTTISEAVAQGASGYLRWQANGIEMSLGMLHAGRRASAPSSAASRRVSGALSDRERQVLVAISDGKSNVEIARELFVSENTIKTHIRRLFGKLGARDRAEAVTIGFRSGLLV